MRLDELHEADFSRALANLVAATVPAMRQTHVLEAICALGEAVFGEVVVDSAIRLGRQRKDDE